MQTEHKHDKRIGQLLDIAPSKRTAEEHDELVKLTRERTAELFAIHSTEPK